MGQKVLPEKQSHIRQNISLNVKDQPLEQILWLITKQTGFYFSYNSAQYNPEKTHSINLRNRPLDEVLKMIFTDTLAEFKLINNQIAVGRKKTIEIEDSASIYVTGIITDATKLLPIPHVNIRLSQRPYGTISNKEGKFAFWLKHNHFNDTINFSCIGYKPYTMPVNTFINQHHQLQLTPVTISLQEVIIRNTNPTQLIKSVISRLKSNYPQKAYHQQCYYREQIKKQDQINRFSEAILDIYKAPPNRPFLSDQARIIQGRNSSGLYATDTLSIKLKAGIKSVLDLDIIKNGIPFLSLDEIENYLFSYNDLIVDNNRLYYQILFTPKEVKHNQIPYEGELLIDIKSLALMQISFNIPQNYLSQASSYFVYRKQGSTKLKVLSSHYQVAYQAIGNTYYPQAIRFTNRFKIKKRGQFSGRKYELVAEAAFLQTDTLQTSPIPRQARVKPYTIIEEEPAINSAEFWGEYSVILPEMPLVKILELNNTIEVTGK